MSPGQFGAAPPASPQAAAAAAGVLASLRQHLGPLGGIGLWVPDRLKEFS